MHANGLLLKPASISLWCDGSFIANTSTIGAAALWYDAQNQLVDYRQGSKNLASSSYEGELHALLLGLRMIRDQGPNRETIKDLYRFQIGHIPSACDRTTISYGRRSHQRVCTLNCTPHRNQSRGISLDSRTREHWI